MESTGRLTVMNSGSSTCAIDVHVLTGIIKKKYARLKSRFVEIKARGLCQDLAHRPGHPAP